MKQPDFFRLFSEKMKAATPPPDFSGDDWQALQTRLDAHDRKRWRVLPLGWLGALTGLLLLSNLGWFSLWQKTDNKVAALRSEQLSEPQKSIMMRDTVFEKTVVYEYDTIYRTVIVNRMETSRVGQNLASQNEPNGTFFTQKTTSGGTDTPTSPASNPTGQNGQVQPPNQINTNTTAGADAAPGSSTEASSPILPKENDLFIGGNNKRQPAPDALPSLEMRALHYLLRQPVLWKKEDFAIVPAKENKTSFPLIPRSFAIGIGAGTLLPRQSSITSSSEKAAIFSAEIGFSDHLALTLDGTYAAFKFRGYVEDRGLGLPVFVPPVGEYDLRYFETHDEAKSILQLSVGMRWYFMLKSKLNPWLGAGWSVQWNPGYELEVEYTERGTGIEKSREVGVPSSQSPLNYTGFNLGLRYQLTEHWQLQTGSFWDFKADSQPGIGRWWGWRAGVGFRF